MKQVSFLIPCHYPGPDILKTLRVVHEHLSARYAGSFEILVIPNGETQESDASARHQLGGSTLPEVRVLWDCPSVGKGAALSHGVKAATGRWVFFTDADLPYDLSFFDHAARRLAQGYDWVTGNRRLKSSRFEVPVPLLPLVYGRHRLGLAYNRVVRWIFPVSVTDTQAGIKAMTSEFAKGGFAAMRTQGFFFDLELFLYSAARGCFHCELPLQLTLRSEKSTVKLAREAVLAVTNLARIRMAWARGQYGDGTKKPARAGARDLLRRFGSKSSLGSKIFLVLRWAFTPYHLMSRRLPPKGRILDLGCGHGLFSWEMARSHPARTVLGIDHDKLRIQAGKEALGELASVSLQDAALLDWLDSPSEEKFDGIALIDVLHYFSPEEQRTVLERARTKLSAQGVLIAREVDPNQGFVSSWNRLYERMATGLGFTRSERKTELTIRSRPEWEALLESAGFEVKSEPCSHPLFADILYVCEPRKTATHS